MDEIQEKEFSGYPSPITYGCTKKIIEQMDKDICKFEIGDIRGTGFLVQMPYNNKILKLFITNNHIINEDILYNSNQSMLIRTKKGKNYKKINLNNRKKYTNKECDITIIEIKEEDKISHCLELDDSIIYYLNNNINNDTFGYDHNDKTIYALQYPERELLVSYGKMEIIFGDKEKYFTYLTNIKEEDSSCAMILNINNKVIGLHTKSYKKYNKGIFLNYPLQEFLQQYDTIDGTVDSLIKKSFNENYSNIITIPEDTEDINIEEIYLFYNNLGNQGLEKLSKNDFKEIKVLYLMNNNISDITSLGNMNFNQLTVLDLSFNQISDITVLENEKFKELKELNLGGNKIYDIRPLENAKFEKLENLYLNNNDISDIRPLAYMNFKDLKVLDLCFNQIYDLAVFEYTNFTELKLLDLSNNRINQDKNASIIYKLKTKRKQVYLE